MFFVQTIRPKIEAALFRGMNGLYMLLPGCFTSPNLERKRLLQQKIVFAFSNQHQCPWAPLVSHRAACLLCFIENFLPASPAAGERGRRGGATQTQRLICLLVKRNSGPHFLMRALIKSGGVWPENGRGGEQRDTVTRGEIRFLPSVARRGYSTGVKPQQKTAMCIKCISGHCKRQSNFPLSFILTCN